MFSPHSNRSKIFYQIGDEDRIRWTANVVVYFGLFQLTDRNIGNSQDTSFEQLIMSETNGRGVNLVLNSLSQQKLQASVRCLALGGRFLQIGKFDLNNNSRLGRLFSLTCFIFTVKCNFVLFRVATGENVISVLAIFKVSIVTKLWAGWLKFNFLAGVRNFSLLLNIWIDSGTQPAYNSIHTRGSFCGSKVVRAWGWPMTCI